jgi:N-methylhydantoinase A
VPRFATDADVAEMVESFHRAHERVFAVRDEAGQVECLNWRGRLTVQLGSRTLAQAAPRATGRSAWFGEGAVAVPLYRGDEAALHEGIAGPAIIEEPTTTLVIYPGSSVRLSAGGNYVVSIQ